MIINTEDEPASFFHLYIYLLLSPQMSYIFFLHLYHLTMESGLILEQPPTTKKQNTNGNAKDRISELPDSVLHHILSFLETKDSVQTSILSKRWTHLWASVPVLDLTDESFIGNDEEEEENDSDTYNFENFVDTVLLLRDAASDLCSFSLRLYYCFDKDRVHRWIRYATKYNAKVLQIVFPNVEGAHLPMGILPCRSLEELSITLQRSVLLGPPKIMGRLRRLHIQVDGQSHPLILYQLDHGLMENIISSCPVLEDLDLHNCLFNGALCISSNTLKRLSIKDCRFKWGNNLISIPSLVCLTYTNNNASTTLENLASLLNATVHTTGNHAIKLVRGLANVETLDFSCSEEAQCELPEQLSQFPMFDNLRSLTLGERCTSDNIQAAACFLKHSPNLKTFILNNRMVSSPLTLRRWEVSHKSGKLSFSCPHLELIEIQCSKDYRNLQVLIKYLLSNATGVPKIVIKRG